jgi:hypothetical protein
MSAPKIINRVNSTRKAEQESDPKTLPKGDRCRMKARQLELGEVQDTQKINDLILFFRLNIPLFL